MSSGRTEKEKEKRKYTPEENKGEGNFLELPHTHTVLWDENIF